MNLATLSSRHICFLYVHMIIIACNIHLGEPWSKQTLRVYQCPKCNFVRLDKASTKSMSLKVQCPKHILVDLNDKTMLAIPNCMSKMYVNVIKENMISMLFCWAIK